MTDRKIRALLAGCALAAGTACFGQTTHTLFFDGGEPGVEAPGTDTFTYLGATFHAGTIHGGGSDGLRASGEYGWQPAIGFINSTIEFSVPVTEVTFFYTHDGFDITGGFAEAYDAGGNLLGVVASNAFTFPGDPGNFVTLSGGGSAIAWIVFMPENPAFPGAGYIDNFSFTVVPAPGALAFAGPGLVVTARRRRR